MYNIKLAVCHNIVWFKELPFTWPYSLDLNAVNAGHFIMVCPNYRHAVLEMLNYDNAEDTWSKLNWEHVCVLVLLLLF